ncbi:hypothetical protein BRARA_C03245 [Brassica rapa]|uniref:Uncharacterized protein n=3 Tax=Brassica TaxID=3705 RepID=A0A398A0I8_BRACM|nr:defensin-like protein 311 [Brassica rapa]XP_022573344.1 defensin-like protein 311 [Brassica napus]KAG5405546.1 hypothetical protein IGI04_011665 [Brassica rapa subsp. trilocularis]KAH0933991.1 hypothetical protein HID58_011108 [Brassica napus]RID71301.1 hypothetical protein BRARA_C03245 [Brassica rapa]CAF2126774.1 unnamed protein product [Brassica napus]CAG7882240.1 unnamed protein product [Brassica rapa]
MEKISAFFFIFFLVSLCMVTVTVGDICHTDQDCIDIGIPRCKRTGRMPICYNGYCSCFAKRPPPAAPTTPSWTTTNS